MPPSAGRRIVTPPAALYASRCTARGREQADAQ